jgi:hypothetical protein
MEKYRLIQERKAAESDSDFLRSNASHFPEVRITQQGKPRNYISYAMNLFVSTSSISSDLYCIIARDSRNVGPHIPYVYTCSKT